MVVRTKDGEGLVYRPGSGGAQGDAIMPKLFRGAYEFILKCYIEDRWTQHGLGIQARDPVSSVEVDVAVTSFADDVRELNLMSNSTRGCEKVSRNV